MVTEMRGYEQKAQQQAAIVLSSQERAAIAVYDAEAQRGIEQYKAGLKIKDATIPEYAALYMLCKNHDLDAWNGEAWIIPGNGVMVGVKGLRKSADKQLPKGDYYNPAPRMLQHSEYAKYGLDEHTPPKGKTWKNGQQVWEDNPIVMVYICDLTRSDATQKWIDQAKELTALTGSYEEAIKIIGPRPVWVGIGIVRKLDKSKMEVAQLARKRAESDAIKQAFSLPFDVDVERNGDDLAARSDIVEGEVVRNGDKPEPKLPQAVEAKSVIEAEVVEPQPAPDPEPQPAVEKPVVSAQVAPTAGKIEIKPEEKPEVKPARGKKQFVPIGSAYKKVDPPAQAEPSSDSNDPTDVLALKRSKPTTWVMAAEWLNKTFKTGYTAGELREEVDRKMGSLFTELSVDAWLEAIEIAQEEAKK